MAKKESHSIKNVIIATILTGGIIVSPAPPIREPILKVLLYLETVIKWTWFLLVNSYRIPGWALAILVLLSLTGAIYIFRALRPSQSPEHHKYTEDSIRGVNWRWSWVKDKISDLSCYCLHCDAQLVHDDSSCRNSLSKNTTYFICENCDNLVASISGGDNLYALGVAEREIMRRIRTKEYLKP